MSIRNLNHFPSIITLLIIASASPQFVSADFGQSAAPSFHDLYVNAVPKGIYQEALNKTFPEKAVSVDTHGLNAVNFERYTPKTQPVVVPAAPSQPPPKIILVVWDRNGEILDDPHIQLREVKEKQDAYAQKQINQNLVVQQQHMANPNMMLQQQVVPPMPVMKMTPLIACNTNADVNVNLDGQTVACHYDLIHGNGVMIINFRHDRYGLIEISYAETEGGDRVSYIEKLKRLRIASDRDHPEHQQHHEAHLGATDFKHNNILHLYYHPYKFYCNIYHIHGIVFWRGVDPNRADPMPLTAKDPFVHIEYFSEHEHAINNNNPPPFELSQNPETGEFRITIRTGYGLDEKRRAEDKSYGKLNLAVAVTNKLFRRRYYRVYTIDVNECINKSMYHENGQKHAEYNKNNPAQILYLWADKDKRQFGPFPLRVSTHTLRIVIKKKQMNGCQKPFSRTPKEWLEIRDEDDAETLLSDDITSTPMDHETLVLQVKLHPTIASGLHIRINCGGAQDYEDNIIVYELPSFTNLEGGAEVPLQVSTIGSPMTQEQTEIQPTVTIKSDQHYVEQRTRDPNSQMVKRFHHKGGNLKHPDLKDDFDGSGTPDTFHNGTTAPYGNANGMHPMSAHCMGLTPSRRLLDPRCSELHQGNLNRLPQHAFENDAASMPNHQFGQMPGHDQTYSGAGMPTNIPSNPAHHFGQTSPSTGSQFGGTAGGFGAPPHLMHPGTDQPTMGHPNPIPVEHPLTMNGMGGTGGSTYMAPHHMQPQQSGPHPSTPFGTTNPGNGMHPMSAYCLGMAPNKRMLDPQCSELHQSNMDRLPQHAFENENDASSSNHHFGQASNPAHHFGQMPGHDQTYGGTGMHTNPSSNPAHHFGQTPSSPPVALPVGMTSGGLGVPPHLTANQNPAGHPPMSPLRPVEQPIGMPGMGSTSPTYMDPHHPQPSGFGAPQHLGAQSHPQMPGTNSFAGAQPPMGMPNPSGHPMGMNGMGGKTGDAFMHPHQQAQPPMGMPNPTGNPMGMGGTGGAFMDPHPMMQPHQQAGHPVNEEELRWDYEDFTNGELEQLVHNFKNPHLHEVMSANDKTFLQQLWPGQDLNAKSLGAMLSEAKAAHQHWKTRMSEQHM